VKLLGQYVYEHKNNVRCPEQFQRKGCLLRS